MQYTRKNVWELGRNWADPILWYARGGGATGLGLRSCCGLPANRDKHTRGGDSSSGHEERYRRKHTKHHVKDRS
jgi:hypothetical protein